MHPIKYIGVLIIILHLFAIGDISDNSQAASTMAAIILDQSEQEANVGPGENGTLIFTGRVEVEMVGPGSNIQMIVVSLSADCIWPTTISPTTMTFQAQGPRQQNFTVTVQVPNFTSSSITEELTVGGTAKVVPGVRFYKIPPSKGIINISAYSILNLSSDDPEKESLRGESLLYLLNIKNDGNSNAQVKVGIDDYMGLTDKGWIIRGPSDDFLVEEGNDIIGEIHVIVPDGTALRTYQFVVNATSDAGTNATDFAEYTFYVDVVNRKTVVEPQEDEKEDENQNDMPKPDESLTISNIRVEPEAPYQSTDVKIFAVIRSHHEIRTAKVNYWLSNSSSSSVPMKISGTDYYANLGRFRDGVTLFYNITAMDAGANFVSSLARTVKVGAESQEENVVEEKSIPGGGHYIVLSSIIITAIAYGSRRR